MRLHVPCHPKKNCQPLLHNHKLKTNSWASRRTGSKSCNSAERWNSASKLSQVGQNIDPPTFHAQVLWLSLSQRLAKYFCHIPMSWVFKVACPCWNRNPLLSLVNIGSWLKGEDAQCLLQFVATSHNKWLLNQQTQEAFSTSIGGGLWGKGLLELRFPLPACSSLAFEKWRQEMLSIAPNPSSRWQFWQFYAKSKTQNPPNPWSFSLSPIPQHSTQHSSNGSIPKQGLQPPAKLPCRISTWNLDHVIRSMRLPP